MKEEPCSVIPATRLTPNFVYYIENCSALNNNSKKKKKKGSGFSTVCAGLIKEDTFFRDRQQSIAWKCATHS